MYQNPETREIFFRTLREEILTIPDIPIINSDLIKSKTQQNEKEALFQHLLQQKLKQDADKVLEKDGIYNTAQEALANLENFEERLKENKNMLLGGAGYQDIKIPKKKIIPETLFNTIMNTKVGDKSLRFRGFVAIFDVKSKDFPIYDVKILQTVCSNYGFHILAHKVLPFNKLDKMLVQKECLIKSEKVSRPDYEELFVNLEGLNFNELLADEKLVPKELQTIRNWSNMGSPKQTMASSSSEMTFRRSGSPKMSRYGLTRTGLGNALILCLLPKAGTSYHKGFTRMLDEKSDLFVESLSLFYSSKNRVESLIDAQMFFPELFQVNFMTLINIPSATSQNKRDLEKRLEDVLSLNNFQVIKRLEAALSRDALVNCFKEIFSNSVNLAEFLLTESKIKIQVAAKLGNLFLNDFGVATESFMKILDQNMNYNLYKHFFPDTYLFSRVFLILRPFILKTNLGELFLNIFRLNGFVVVKRINLVLSPDQALYLAKHEKIEKECEDEYVGLMRDGACEIILLSNYAAVEKASVIVDGSNNEWTRADQIFNVNLGEEENSAYGNTTHQLFKSLKDSVSLEKIYDYSASSLHSKQIDERIQIQEKTKLMKASMASSFNFCAFSSRTKEATEELISLFLPDCAKVSNVYVILKPEYIKHESHVTTLFQRLGYKVSDKKQQKLPTEKMRALLTMLDKDKREDNITSDIEEEWENEFILFNLVKPAGKKEMLSLLRNFFLHSQFKPTLPITKENLYQLLVPCWNTSAIDFVNSDIYHDVRVFDPTTYKKVAKAEQKEIVRYILDSTLGDSMKQKAKDADDFTKSQVETTDNFQEVAPVDQEHLYIKASTARHGDYQIRIRNLKTNSTLYLKSLKEEYDCINLYYTHVNHYYSQKCPTFYQYRIVPDEEEVAPNHIFDCQEYMGDFFLKTVCQEMLEQKKQKLDRSNKYNSDLFKSDRSPLAAFMYGSRLATYVKKLEEVKGYDISGCGQIRIVDNKPRGIWSLETIQSNELQRYSEILSKVSHCIPELQLEVLQAIDVHINKVFSSETYKFSRKAENLRLVPEFLNAQSIRIFTKPDNRDMKVVHDQYKTIHYDFERNTYTSEKQLPHNKDFALIYVTPQISGKYALIANILYLIDYEFTMMDKKTDLLNNNYEDYESLLKGLREGVYKHHNIDKAHDDFLETQRLESLKKLGREEDPVDFIQMELLFVLLEALDRKVEKVVEMKNNLGEEMDMLQTMNRETFQQTQQTATTAATATEQEYETYRRTRNENIAKLHLGENNLLADIKLLLNKIAKLQLCPSRDEKEALRGGKIKIARERYYKPLFSQDIEHNLYKDKYKKNVTNYQNLLRSRYRTAEFFQNVDTNQARWVNPPDLIVYDIKKYEEKRLPDLYVDPILIPGEEAEKELLRSEISKMVYFKNIKK